MSSLRRGHANLLCIVPIFTDDSEEFRDVGSPEQLMRGGGTPAALWGLGDKEGTGNSSHAHSDAWSASYVHTKVKAPDPIRTPKLSTFGPAQYYGGGPRGNRR